MSRNRDIKTLHEMTGFKYSVLRKALKTNGWNSWRALCSIDGVDPDCLFELGSKCGEFIEDLCTALLPICEAVTQFVATFTEVLQKEGLELLDVGGEDE
jgi:hypothetical protein